MVALLCAPYYNGYLIEGPTISETSSGSSIVTSIPTGAGTLSLFSHWTHLQNSVYNLTGERTIGAIDGAIILIYKPNTTNSA